MANFIELIAKIKQKNNGTFKLVDAQDVECEDGKGLDEVLNEKLEINLGADNANKVLVTDADGNVTTQNKEDFEGGGTGNYNDLENKPTINGIELSGNKTSKDLKMYTQEEVDYMLNDKMDKPYYDTAIADDTTIENTLAGNFKIDSIEGNIYQAEESGIVPTPERPIPIRSKKIKVGEEYVELRSLKESKNLFDKNLLVANAGNNQKDSPAIQLKDKETYTISCSKNGVKCILGVCAKRKSDNLDAEIQLLRGVTEQGSFTVDYTTYENYFVRVYSTAYDTIDTIQLELGSSATSYVPATVRDYKIVDHTTKTSKIVRNVLVVKGKDITSMKISDISSSSTTKRWTTNFTIISANDKELSNIFNCVGYYKISTEGFGVSADLLGLLLDKEKYTSFEQVKELIKDGEFYLKMAKSTEESIPYIETDTSEVGLSWQDTTSPSPDIQSKIYEVEELNIKTVGKNLINLEKIDMNTIDNIINVYFTSDVIIKCYEIATVSSNIWRFKFNYKDGTAKCITDHHLKSDERFRIVKSTKENPIVSITYRGTYITSGHYSQIMLEYGNVSSPYEPYQETSIKHTLSKPLRGINGINDAINIIENKIDRKILKIDVTTLPLWIKGSNLYDKENTTARYGSYEENRNMVQYGGISPILKNPKIAVWQIDIEGFTINAGCQIHISINNDRLNISKDDSSEERTNKFVEYINDLKKTGKEFVYAPLNVVITEPLEDELVQKLKTLKTFSPVTHVFVEGIAKPKLNAKYPKDIAAAQAQLEAKVITLQEAVIKNV